jgi:hypothetical protein
MKINSVRRAGRAKSSARETTLLPTATPDLEPIVTSNGLMYRLDGEVYSLREEIAKDFHSPGSSILMAALENKSREAWGW